MILKCTISNSDFISTVEGPHTEMLRSNRLIECNKTSIEKQHWFNLPSNANKKWSYSCIPITAILRKHPTGSHSCKWVFPFYFLSYSLGPLAPAWATWELCCLDNIARQEGSFFFPESFCLNPYFFTV